MIVPICSGNGRTYAGELLYELHEPITVRISPDDTREAYETQTEKGVDKSQGEYFLTCGLATAGNNQKGIFELCVERGGALFLMPHPDTGQIVAFRGFLDDRAKEYVQLFDDEELEDRWYTVGIRPPRPSERLQYKREHDVPKNKRISNPDSPNAKAGAKGAKASRLKSATRISKDAEIVAQAQESKAAVTSTTRSQPRRITRDIRRGGTRIRREIERSVA